jgi:competence protein ComEC
MLAMWERGTLRYSVKKWAAVAAIIGSFAYLLLSGMTMPTQRAFLMTGIVLLAVIL